MSILEGIKDQDKDAKQEDKKNSSTEIVKFQQICQKRILFTCNEQELKQIPLLCVQQSKQHQPKHSGHELTIHCHQGLTLK